MAQPDDDPNILQPGHAPTPFTAGEIKDGCPAGRTIGMLIEPRDGDPYLTINRFVTVDDDGADHEVKSLTMDGEEIDPPAQLRTKWREFQAHASFDAEQTEIASEVLETRMGELRCKRYTVTDGPTSDVYWFAVDKPGMPVKVETTAPGGVTYRLTMINDNR
jgi:hypothetical protein